MKKKIPLVLLVLAAAFTAWKLSHREPFMYAGTVEATYVDISPQVTTTIASVDAREGDPVKMGQTLVNLTGDDIKLAAEIAERDYQRALKLRNSGSLPQESFDRLRFKRDDAALRASWCVIKSPLDGNVIDRYHEPGELVNPAMKLLTLADLNHVYAYLYVPQTMLARVKVGQTVDAVIPELDMKRIPATITHVRDQAEFTPKNVQTREERTRLVYGIKISFDNADRLLKPGMTVEVKLNEK
jgi:HlyD family secretion protein